jgi:hypothetical protein
VGGEHVVVLIGGEEQHRTRACAGHPDHHRVGSVEHGGAVGRHVLHDHTLDHGQVFHRADVGQAQVIAHADVGHHGHVAAVEGEAFAQHAATGGLEDRGIHIRVQQDVAGAARAAAVAGIDAPLAHIDAVGVGHAHPLAGHTEQVGGEAHGGGLAVGAGHRHHRDPAVLAGLEHVGDNRLAHRSALAVGRLQVHAQAGGGVAFDDAAALGLQGSSMLSHTTSTPQMSRPMLRAAAMARSATSGCTSSVTSVAVPPVDRLALLRRITRLPLGGTDSAS